ncbi:MAG TPA: hypothetical protein VMQ17_08745 [Candidatus Sulfotelmatobacter sp.]|nr:hypothetical protein [Candidatus Sulfotelmatobacter sp.]
MTKTLKRILTALFTYALFDALILGYAGFLPGVQLAAAQTTLTQTTLAADMPVGPASLAGGAQGALVTTVNLTSATGVQQAFNGSPITWIYVDTELMGVLTTVPGQTTIFNVQRAQQGTKAAFHKANAVVYIQVGSPQFGGFSGSGGLYLSDPPIQGSCLASGTLVTPWINVISGTQFLCGTFVTPGGSVLTGWIPASEPQFPSQNIAQTLYVNASYTNATTTYSNVPNLAFVVQANRNYSVNCNLTWQVSGTVGPKFQFTGPGSPTSVAINASAAQTATTSGYGSATAFASSVTGTGGTVTTTTNFVANVTLGLINGANSGTVQLQAAENGAGTLTIQPGSYCEVQ